jgi:hypothetical protein
VSGSLVTGCVVGDDRRLSETVALRGPLGQRHVVLVSVACTASWEDVAQVVVSAATEGDYVVGLRLAFDELETIGAASLH